MFEDLAGDLFQEVLSGGVVLASHKSRHDHTLEVRDVAHISRQYSNLPRPISRTRCPVLMHLQYRTSYWYHDTRFWVGAGDDREEKGGPFKVERKAFEKVASSPAGEGSRCWPYTLKGVAAAVGSASHSESARSSGRCKRREGSVTFNIAFMSLYT